MTYTSQDGTPPCIHTTVHFAPSTRSRRFLVLVEFCSGSHSMNTAWASACTQDMEDVDVYHLTLDDNSDAKKGSPAAEDTDLLANILGFTTTVALKLRSLVPEYAEVSPLFHLAHVHTLGVICSHIIITAIMCVCSSPFTQACLVWRTRRPGMPPECTHGSSATVTYYTTEPCRSPAT